MLRLINQIANALTHLHHSEPKEPSNYIELHLVGTIKIDNRTRDYYFEAQNNGEQYRVRQEQFDLVCYEAFFNKRRVKCLVEKTKKTNNYYQARFAGNVKNIILL